MARVDRAAAGPHVAEMRNRGVWTAFLLMCFLITGLVGLFASYATPIPLERALIRTGVLDQVLDAAQAPDAAAKLEALRPQLGDQAQLVLSGPGNLAARVATARAAILSEEAREENSIGFRSRLMIIVVTVLASGLGAGLLAMAVRGAQREGALS